MLGLGELTLIQHERVQVGRLDILLTDADAESTRYEVEIILGPDDRVSTAAVLALRGI